VWGAPRARGGGGGPPAPGRGAEPGGPRQAPPMVQRPEMARPERARPEMRRPEMSPPEAPPDRSAEARAAQQRSISEAVRWVQRSTGGQILGAEQVPFEGRSITRVKYMDHRGRVRYMDAPGSSGERRGRGGPRRDDNDDP